MSIIVLKFTYLISNYCTLKLGTEFINGFLHSFPSPVLLMSIQYAPRGIHTKLHNFCWASSETITSQVGTYSMNYTK
jgi:hypothetical protein